MSEIDGATLIVRRPPQRGATVMSGIPGLPFRPEAERKAVLTPIGMHNEQAVLRHLW
jgi:hypothetical protein